jgi:hypothetical protein
MNFHLISFIFLIFVSNFSFASCEEKPDLLLVGDSQTGATWSKSYIGNFLANCLQGNFLLLSRGGSIPMNWLGTSTVDRVETIQRDPDHNQINLGLTDVPLCKRRLQPMLDSYKPSRIVFQFGGNYIASNDEDVKKDTERLMKLVIEKGFSKETCFYVTPTFEMEVATKRNVPLKDLKNVTRVTNIIASVIQDRCQLISGLEMMKNSPYFDGKELLKRVLIEGKPGCGGAAVNDNAHVCGEAAKDFAQRVCTILN